MKRSSHVLAHSSAAWSARLYKHPAKKVRVALHTTGHLRSIRCSCPCGFAWLRACSRRLSFAPLNPDKVTLPREVNTKGQNAARIRLACGAQRLPPPTQKPTRKNGSRAGGQGACTARKRPHRAPSAPRRCARSQASLRFAFTDPPHTPPIIPHNLQAEPKASPTTNYLRPPERSRGTTPEQTAPSSRAEPRENFPHFVTASNPTPLIPRKPAPSLKNRP